TRTIFTSKNVNQKNILTIIIFYIKLLKKMKAKNDVGNGKKTEFSNQYSAPAFRALCFVPVT
ncbi:MAG: hypothetical protein JW976_02005, partial [Syntrophaceae bacterium]|nr:hypothetical protein [Syntrophaceae bacterium]